jgi:hypothetical protein
MRAADRTGARLASALVAALALAFAACSDDASADGEAEDVLATGGGATALEASTELSRLFVPLEASADLAMLGPDAARARKVQDAATAFRGLVTDPACVTVTTDAATYLDVAFERCRLALLLTLDGSLHAGVAIEAAGGVPSRVVASVTIQGLVLTGPLRTRRLSGALELRQVIQPQGAPVEVEADLGLAGDAGTVALRLAGERTVDGECVTLTGGAQLSGEPLGELGPIALSGQQVRRCRDACPVSGSVELSYGRGTLLAWTYTGAETASVIGPRGKRIEVLLPCAGG